ncbi:uncharacterized protein LOC122063171 isoform X4 [Macadamia integrifolia]|uniref:uncharacterized protein LOC122063171 isoform X4 n=1 Tax=Macadamia integrifolia TaxID=60698 RepID=UPI001C4E639F|nr:uncharacterized protein LOC122063171 isoform X4 [Macadamia integrifolia]
MGKAHAWAGEHVKQVEKLKGELEAQKRNKEALEARGSEAQNKIDALNMKLENLQKINDEQKIRIHKTEHSLQVAEEEMMKANFEVNSKIKDLMEVRPKVQLSNFPVSVSCWSWQNTGISMGNLPWTLWSKRPWRKKLKLTSGLNPTLKQLKW